ncbi:MAG TPA: PEP-CTERM sorting domain-containing protein, partial [Gemmataceae bacterium]|nr:PEP-CTERM sorting domain-containing protein [Gemmataceae bacterium]
PDGQYYWPIITWQGTYTGPTDYRTLTQDTQLDLTNFANPTFFERQFVMVYDGVNKRILLEYTYFVVIPEPNTLTLTAAGLLGVWRFRRRRGH